MCPVRKIIALFAWQVTKCVEVKFHLECQSLSSEPTNTRAASELFHLNGTEPIIGIIGNLLTTLTQLFPAKTAAEKMSI